MITEDPDFLHDGIQDAGIVVWYVTSGNVGTVDGIFSNLLDDIETLADAAGLEYTIQVVFG